MLEEALEQAGDELGVESVIETRLAFAVHVAGDFAGAKRHADRALSLAEELGSRRCLLRRSLSASCRPSCSGWEWTRRRSSERSGSKIPTAPPRS